MNHCPLPLFDSLAYIKSQDFDASGLQRLQQSDVTMAASFLQCYVGSQGTFNSYRREVERLLQWSWNIKNKTLVDLRRDDIEDFLRFCQQPPLNWIGIKKAPRFIVKEDFRIANPEWRPFVVTVSKTQHRAGYKPEPKQFSLSQGALKECLAILSSFFNYLLQEDHVQMNPVALMRQKSKFIRKSQSNKQIRRLSELQWQAVIEQTQKLAETDPDTHERSLFMMSAFYALYLRISEFAASERWQPVMSHFHRDSEGNWWFTTVGKGNKEREIAVSDEMLTALKRWRKYLGLTTLPSAADNSPLLPKIRGKGPMKSINHIRRMVQFCFDQTIYQLRHEGFIEEAENLQEATVHWLRHTGISDDVKHRPREHVRDDAGHSSSAITDKYIDIEMRERHRSARKKQITD